MPVAEARHSAGMLGNPAAGSPKILVVEDDLVDRMAFERMVESQGLPYRCRYATSLAEARKILAAESFDVILTDHNLGDGSGLEVLELVADRPVIVITGAGNEETAIRAMRAGAYDYLTKDVDGRYLKVVPVTVDAACRRHASERRARMLQQALTSINDSIYITDREGRFLFVNQTFRDTYGYREEEVLGQPEEILWADAEAGPELCRPAALPAAGERGECLHRRADGSELAVLLARSPIVDDDGVAIAAVGAARDISERKRWELALQESEERYALAAAGSNDGLWDWHLGRRRVYYSERFKSTLGYRGDELEPIPEAWFDLVHDDDLDLLRAQIEAHVEGKTSHFENEHRIRSRDGEVLWVQARGLAVRDREGKAYRLAGSLRDVTDRKRAEEQLIHAALHDSLTGLPNRALFMDRLDNAIKRQRRRPDHSFGVIFLDLDRFKVINDSLGHLAGDQLLQAIGRRLQGCLRIADTVARLGGDEFGVLLEDLDDEAEVAEVAERIDEELRRPFLIDGREFRTAASLGVALSSTGYERAEDLLRDADTAMYRAKSRQSRGRQVVFDPAMHARAVALLDLENDLRRAVEELNFEVHFQPILSLAAGGLKGFEALVRWPHPERGLVSPGDFLPLARETGLLPAIGWWVLGRSCRLVRGWQRRFPAAAAVTVAVNLDGQQLSSAEFPEEVAAALQASGLAPTSLELEITEDMIIDNPELTAVTLERLRADGIGLHIDDFGTGYSSLSQLHRFPVDALKIDRSFVWRMSAEGEEIVRTIVSLAHNLGLEVMAEGIETVDQLERLRELGCQLGQGFLFAKPLSPAGVEELLGRQPLVFPGFANAESGGDERRTSGNSP